MQLLDVSFQTLIWIYLPIIPCYIIVRLLLIKAYYQFRGILSVSISDEKIVLPANRLIGYKNGQLTLCKNDIQNIHVYYMQHTKSKSLSCRALQLSIVMNSGLSVVLKVDYFPLQPMIYLLTYFSYPLSFEQKHFAMLGMLRLFTLVLPVFAVGAIVGLLVSESF